MLPIVIIPTYNERLNLPALVTQLLRVEHLQILVIDDNSPDGTADEADRLAAQSAGRLMVRRRRGPKGFGPSYLEGMRAALEAGATHILQMDADLSHDPADVPRLLQASHAADLVLGSRYVAGGQLRNWPLHRRLLSEGANLYVRLVTRLPIRDVTSGFRCWRRELLSSIDLNRIVSDGYAFLVEMLYEAHRSGCSIGEVPIIFVERRIGTSKLSSGVLIESLIMPWRLRFKG